MRSSQDTRWHVVLQFAIFLNYKSIQSAAKGEDLTCSNACMKQAPDATIMPRHVLVFFLSVSFRTAFVWWLGSYTAALDCLHKTWLQRPVPYVCVES